MRFDIITLFPGLFEPHLSQGITRRAFESGQVQVRLWQLRDFASDNYRRVDDRPYGGGPGMVMLAEPLLAALKAAREERAEAQPLVIHFTPSGQPLTQSMVQELAQGSGAICLCGRYEGLDQRVIDSQVTHEISLGDFVLSGGELPALAMLDAVARLQPGVLLSASHEQDSFSDGLLEGPHYSRPEHLLLDGADCPVPPVLMSGNHRDISRWRRQRALQVTAQRRPELIARARALGLLGAEDEAFLRQLASA